MEKRDPRKMALQIAGLRAYETNLPEGEGVFRDPYAEYFFPEEIRKMAKDPAWVRAEHAKNEQIMPGVNGAIVARIRFIDESLADAIQEGFKQLVIVGAGYDTRAYRVKGVKENLAVFEVDHPLTQEIKVKTIEAILGALPEHVTYVPVIFGENQLGQCLLERGYRRDMKTLFIIEGMLMYIPAPAVDSLLSFISRASAPGSALVADYFATSVIDGTSPLQEAKVLRKFVESEGAPLQFGIQKNSSETFFNARVFRIVHDINALTCKENYFKGISASRPVTPMFNFVYAAVR